MASNPYQDDEQAVTELVDLARSNVPVRDIALAVRSLILKKDDDTLFDALERLWNDFPDAYWNVREAVDEQASTVVIVREGAPAMEANAFAIPMFIESRGGLQAAQGFQDPDAYEALVASITAAGLESPEAKVVLVQHWYDLAAIDRLGYSAVHELVREAAAAMGSRKLKGVPLLERSMADAQPRDFGPDDNAMELRFLLGFTLRRGDDPFYSIPKDPAKAEEYFARREAAFTAWTQRAEPLLARLLAPAGSALSINVRSQDVVHAAKDAAVAELAILELMFDIGAALQADGLAAGASKAHVEPGPAEGMLSVVLRSPTGKVLLDAVLAVPQGIPLEDRLATVISALDALGCSYTPLG
jgi:hypothetical protein